MFTTTKNLLFNVFHYGEKLHIPRYIKMHSGHKWPRGNFFIYKKNKSKNLSPDCPFKKKEIFGSNYMKIKIRKEPPHPGIINERSILHQHNAFSRTICPPPLTFSIIFSFHNPIPGLYLRHHQTKLSTLFHDKVIRV